MARRGTVPLIWLDNGTNFVGARNESQQGFKEMKHNKIKNFLQENGADWILWYNNPPCTSHVGGVWECQIWSARIILEGLLKIQNHSLNVESVRTLMADLIINSRLFTVETISDSKRERPFSPSNLLTMKINVVMPPQDEFSKPDVYSKNMAMCTAYCWIILKQIDKGISASKAYMKKEDTKPCNWWYCFTERWLSLDSVANSNNSWYWCWSKNDVCSATFWVVDKKCVPGQILRRPIAKLVLLVENEFDTPTDGAITKLTKWELFYYMILSFDFCGMIKLYLVMSCHSWSDMHLNHTSFILWLSSSLNDLLFLHCNWNSWRINSTVALEKCNSMD